MLASSFKYRGASMFKVMSFDAILLPLAISRLAPGTPTASAKGDHGDIGLRSASSAARMRIHRFRAISVKELLHLWRDPRSLMTALLLPFTQMLLFSRGLAAGFALVAISFGGSAGIALAGELPRLNVGPSCDAAARGAVVAGRNKAACMSDEDAALDVLKKNWSKYAGDNKTQCIGTVSTGGPASYVELLSCLEIMRDARAIQATIPVEERIPDLLPSGNGRTITTESNPKTRRQHHPRATPSP
jgi:hypothetical protein